MIFLTAVDIPTMRLEIDAIRPAMHELYRHRATGCVARLRQYRRWCGGANRVHLRSDSGGWEWYGSTEEFWHEFIHTEASHDH